MPSLESSDLTSSAATPLGSNADHIAATAGDRDLDSGDPATSASAIRGILLQKSKVAGPPIFRENTKREAITDSYNLNRIVEVTSEFNVRR
jgi:hypothetical protein